MFTPAYRLFAPGPTPVPDAVRLALARPVLHHRTAAFEAVFAQIRAALRWLLQTEQEVLCLAGSGTLAMEAAVSNILSPGDQAIYVNGGKFGERWGEILRAYGVEALEISVPWGCAVEPAQVAAALRRYPAAVAVYLQACETSTATQHPVAAVARCCAGRALCVVDGITAVGVSDVAMQRDGIDILLTGSQKALMLPPGLAFMALSPRAWQATQRARLPRFYVDLQREKKAAQQNQSAWTSSVTLMVGLQASLQLLQQAGLPALFARHALLGHMCRAGLLAAGCTLYSQAPAAGVTAVCPPRGIAASEVIATLRDTYNLTVVGGQDRAAGHMVRVAHMGCFDVLDMLTLVGTFELVLLQLAAAKQLAPPMAGRAVAASQRVLQAYQAPAPSA